ncbi:hypothetical protein TNCT_23971 [Trichonephila clavata]|uniref:Uncharacterized protein n=1 Tax=Trichonephila clavata TaxID=2740835 RepID=A0A8X6KJH9_TRICU|nr:hypothetical protein TNCT_23971 [Trichonephila clavata]
MAIFDESNDDLPPAGKTSSLTRTIDFTYFFLYRFSHASLKNNKPGRASKEGVVKSEYPHRSQQNDRDLLSFPHAKKARHLMALSVGRKAWQHPSSLDNLAGVGYICQLKNNAAH